MMTDDRIMRDLVGFAADQAAHRVCSIFKGMLEPDEVPVAFASAAIIMITEMLEEVKEVATPEYIRAAKLLIAGKLCDNLGLLGELEEVRKFYEAERLRLRAKTTTAP